MKRLYVLAWCLFNLPGLALAAPGDVTPDGKPDGKLDPTDAQAAWQMSRGLLSPDMDADVAPLNTPNGKIELEDAVTIIKHYLGTLTITKSSKGIPTTTTAIATTTTTTTDPIKTTSVPNTTTSIATTTTTDPIKTTSIPNTTTLIATTTTTDPIKTTSVPNTTTSIATTTTTDPSKTTSIPNTTTSVATTTTQIPTTTTSVSPSTTIAPITSTASTTTILSIDYTNKLGMQFKLLAPSTFTMGSPATEPGRDQIDEKQHLVTISKAFYMGTTEVTQGQWKAVMGTNPSFFSSCGETCPVEQVSWNQIQTFLATLNLMGEGVYRLPTEAEWEYAARAGTTKMYFFQADSASDYAWYESNSGKITHPVATKLPNPWGLYDMFGNVWEWVSDWYYQDYTIYVKTDPLGMSDGITKVLRGGSAFPGESLRSAERYSIYPETPMNNIGFRLVKVP